jgi:hypothetical protein
MVWRIPIIETPPPYRPPSHSRDADLGRDAKNETLTVTTVARKHAYPFIFGLALRSVAIGPYGGTPAIGRSQGIVIRLVSQLVSRHAAWR